MEKRDREEGEEEPLCVHVCAVCVYYTACIQDLRISLTFNLTSSLSLYLLSLLSLSTLSPLSLLSLSPLSLPPLSLPPLSSLSPLSLPPLSLPSPLSLPPLSLPSLLSLSILSPLSLSIPPLSPSFSLYPPFSLYLPLSSLSTLSLLSLSPSLPLSLSLSLSHTVFPPIYHFYYAFPFSPSTPSLPISQPSCLLLVQPSFCSTLPPSMMNVRFSAFLVPLPPSP